MPTRTLVTGTDGADTRIGGAGAELIYGFDPNGPQANVSVIAGTLVASGLNQPLFATHAPADPGRLFILEKPGAIQVLDLATGALGTFLDISAEVADSGEQGLLGLAFAPDFASTRFLYLYFSNNDGDGVIRRYTMNTSGDGVEAGSEHHVATFDFPNTTTNHRGGWIGFGPDGYLYIALGDGAANSSSAQSLSTPLGKMLRIDPTGDDFPADATLNYAIPPDNPAAIDGIAGDASGTGIFAAGLRNPYRDSFDRGLGDLFIADVGASSFEEINAGASGANYGWPSTEGTFNQGAFPDFTQPIHAYAHGGSSAVQGGYVYRGGSEGLQGQYFFADFNDDTVSTLRFNGASWVATDRTAQIVYDVGSLASPVSFGEDAFGNLYIVSIAGSIYRLTPTVASADQGDTLEGGGGDDMIIAGSGADSVRGDEGDDVLLGGPGADLLYGGVGADGIDGGEGFDTVAFSSPASVNLATGFTGGEAAGDYYANTERFLGSAGSDTFVGDAAANSFYGNGGADALAGGEGDDVLFGGGGGDVVDGGIGADIAGFAAAVSVDLANGAANTGEASGDVYIGIETFLGSGENDLFLGNALANRFEGGAGADRLSGQSGDDVLLGGSGKDLLTGGAGLDDFVFTSLADSVVVFAGRDAINAFAHGDKIDLSAIDANVNVAGDQAFTWSPGGLTGVAGQLTVQQNAARSWTVWADIDGDGAADFALNIYGAPALNNGIFAWDFIL